MAGEQAVQLRTRNVWQACRFFPQLIRALLLLLRQRAARRRVFSYAVLPDPPPPMLLKHSISVHVLLP